MDTHKNRRILVKVNVAIFFDFIKILVQNLLLLVDWNEYFIKKPSLHMDMLESPYIPILYRIVVKYDLYFKSVWKGKAI